MKSGESSSDALAKTSKIALLSARGSRVEDEMDAAPKNQSDTALNKALDEAEKYYH
jgi:hypothetical protein